jgi:hypothetical protein
MNVKSTMICAAMLAVGMLPAAPALANSNPFRFNVAVYDLVTYKISPASAGLMAANPPSTHFQTGDLIAIKCRYDFTGSETKDMIAKRRQWTIGLYLDGQKIGTQVGTWPTPNTINQFEAAFTWQATAGLHTVLCVVNDNGAMTETSTQDDRRSVSIDVTGPHMALGFGPSKRMALNKGNMSKPGIGPMPNAHLRTCPTSVKAVSKIDPGAFYAPFATASKPTNIPDGHFNLYLRGVETFNDTLLCTYATRAGNAKTTVELSCSGAQKTANGAYCQ